MRLIKDKGWVKAFKLLQKNYLGKRYIKDYICDIWLMLQQKDPEDLVLATGKTTTVRSFCEMAFAHLGIKLRWEGEGINEKGIVAGMNEKIMAKHLNGSTTQQSNSSTSKPINSSTLTEGQPLIEVDPQYFRPTEVEMLLGDPARAKEKLGWEPEFSIRGLCITDVHFDFTPLRSI
jgi:GDPmannose 4,6-dehydratase